MFKDLSLVFVRLYSYNSSHPA